MGLLKVKKNDKFDSQVCETLVEQVEAFTVPRGHLEMGGLLIGHVNEEGHPVSVVGFFPKQIEANAGYCSFGGEWVAIAGIACDHANTIVKESDDSMFDIRIMGWVHTHPDIGIFLSGIDIDTFSTLRGWVPEGKFTALVVDPLQKMHGVFNTERRPRDYDAAISIKISNGMKERYNTVLNHLEMIRERKGEEELPFILTGMLRQERISEGKSDDVNKSWQEGVINNKKHLNEIKAEFTEIQNETKFLRKEITKNLTHRIEQSEQKSTKVVGDVSAKMTQKIDDLQRLTDERFKDLEQRVENPLNDRVAIEEKLTSTQSQLKSTQAQLKETLNLNREFRVRIAMVEKDLRKAAQKITQIQPGIENSSQQMIRQKHGNGVRTIEESRQITTDCVQTVQRYLGYGNRDSSKYHNQASNGNSSITESNIIAKPETRLEFYDKNKNYGEKKGAEVKGNEDDDT